MGFEADTRINLLEEPKSTPPARARPSVPASCAIAWEGGVLW
jgi:hypothetical protein